MAGVAPFFERLLGWRPVSPSDWAVDRNDFVAVDHGVDPISPMLHQLSARSDQGEGTDIIVDRLDAVLVEMRKAQLDNIAIPKLVVLGVDLLMAGVEKVLRKPWAQCSVLVS